MKQKGAAGAGAGDFAGRTVMKGKRQTAILTTVLFAAFSAGGLTSAARAGEGKGIVQVPWDQFELLVRCDGEYETFKSTNGSCSLPVGNHELIRLSLKSRDDKGRSWEMRSKRASRTLKVRDGKVVHVPVSPPFVARLTVSRHRVRSGQEIRFGVEMMDSEGWLFEAPAYGRSRPPRLVLTDVKGRQIRKYAFAYG